MPGCRCKFRQVSNFTAASRGFRTNLIFLETTITDLQFGSIFIQIFLAGSERLFYLCKSDVSTVQGHPRSLILVPIESAYATYYVSCTISEPLFHPNFGSVPVGPDADIGVNVSMRAGTLSYSAVKLFSMYCNLCDHGT